MLLESADTRIQFRIKHPRGLGDIVVMIGFFKGHPLITIQDSKHSLKTFHNNLFTGARLLVLGNYTARYDTMHNIAFMEASPLYHQDVEKLDRQDDHAATRLCFTVASHQASGEDWANRLFVHFWRTGGCLSEPFYGPS